MGRATTSTSYISDDGYLQLSGTPGTEFTITLQTQNTRHISFSRDSKLGRCPLGFTLKNEVCVCSPSTSYKCLVGITECNMSNFRAFLQIGYWVGCTRDDKIAISYCPAFMCDHCPYGTVGLLFYVISELVPLILLFAVIMIMKLKMTSGLMQSTLLFAQTIAFINHTPLFIITSKASQAFLRIHTFLIGFVSLDFFRLDELSSGMELQYFTT